MYVAALIWDAWIHWFNILNWWWLLPITSKYKDQKKGVKTLLLPGNVGAGPAGCFGNPGQSTKAGIGWVLPYQTTFHYLVENQTKPLQGNWLRSNPNQTLPYCTKPKPFLGGKVRLGKFLSYQTILHPEVNIAVVPHQNYQGIPHPEVI